MIRINLLPPADRLPKWRTGRLFLAMSLAVIFLFAAIYAFGEAKSYYTNNEIKDTRTRLARLQPVWDKMITASGKQQAINQKQQLLGTLARQQPACYPVLAQLGMKTPPQLWLTSLDFQKDTLKIAGMTQDYADLVVFMQNLEQDILLSEAVLVKAEQDPALPATKFEVTVKIRGQ